MEEGIASKEVYGLSLIDFKFIFDDHDEFEDSESFKDEYSR